MLRRAPKSSVTSTRNPEQTRQRLLAAAFEQMRRSGFNNTDLDTIITAAGVTKGALYHHFTSKEALGYAIVDEILVGLTRTRWLEPLQNAADPIAALVRLIKSLALDEEEMKWGCPLHNLALEMSPLDEEFRARVAKVFSDWQSGIAATLRAGQKRGLVRKDCDAGDAAIFLIAIYEGYMLLAKTSHSPRVVQSGVKNMVRYLESLRSENTSKSRTAGA